MPLQYQAVEGDQFPLTTARNQAVPENAQPDREIGCNLVRAARDGDHDAFRELYKRFYPMVHGILLSRGPHSDIDDLVQEIFLQAWRQLHALRDDRAFAGWLAKIARRRSADYFRRVRRAEQLPPDLRATATDEESWFLLNAIRRLPEAYRETLILRFVENLTGPEIALLTGLTPDSVRVNLHSV